MLREKMIYGGLAIIGTVFLALAAILPIPLWVPLVGPMSAWSISPLICNAIIAAVAFAASLPLWRARRRAWLAPLIAGCIILVPALAIFFDFISYIVSTNTELLSSLLSYGGSAPVSLIPAYLSAMSFSLLFTGALFARRMRDPSVAGSGRGRGTGGKAPATAFDPGGNQP
jgi:hypothetical protein